MVTWDVPRTPTGALLALRFGEERGVAPEVSLAGTGLTAAELSDPTREVLAAQELGVIRNVVAALGAVPGLGLEAGLRFRLSSYGIWGFALVTSPTLRSAVDVAFQFLDLTFAFSRIERRLCGEDLQIVLGAEEVEPELRRFVVERDAAAIRVLALDLLAEPVTAAVEFAFPEPPAEVVGRATALFGVRPLYGAPETVLTLPAALLDHPLPQANEVTMAMALGQCRDLLDRRRARGGLSGQVRDQILAGLAGPPDARAVASALHLGERTLRHRLAAEGTTFRSLLDEVRERLAEEMLVLDSLPVAEIARRLGYVEVSSFSQAFRRWKGTSPRAFRQASASSRSARRGA